MLKNYSFVLDGILAGCALPGRGRELLEDLRQAADDGVKGLVTLTETPLPSSPVAEAGIEYAHIPVEDFQPPTFEQMDQFVAFVEKIKGRGGATLVHCHAGIGRTGTMCAVYLISQGMTADAAIERVRLMRPGSIETRGQERIIRQWAARQAE